jgi:hypothetical protein
MAGLPPLTLDHVADLLGVEVPSGGRHERMGTHNLLMRLGGDTYLESSRWKAALLRHPSRSNCVRQMARV